MIKIKPAESSVGFIFVLIMDQFNIRVVNIFKESV